MTIERKICSCTKPLEPIPYITRSLKIFQLIFLLSLLVYIFDIIQIKSKPQTKSESFIFSLKMIFNIVLNLFTFYCITIINKNWSVIRYYGLLIVILKSIRLLMFVLGCLINIGLYIYIIEEQETRRDVIIVILDIVAEILSIGVSVFLFGWMIFMGLGILKMTNFLKKLEQKEFSEIKPDNQTPETDFQTQIITVENEDDHVDLKKGLQIDV